MRLRVITASPAAQGQRTAAVVAVVLMALIVTLRGLYLT